MRELTVTPAADSFKAPFLDGGGEMGARIRSFDWSKTPLGSPDTWPQSLRSALSICLNSNFPIAIYWGNELSLLYNDAWSPIPGDKHPWALGRSAKEVWPEIWDAISPQFQKAFNGEPGGSKDALLPMQRHGYTEECYFDFTFTPVYGENGRIDGVFNAVIETTYRIINERRTSFLRNLALNIASVQNSTELFQRTIEFIKIDSKDIPFALLYTIDGDRPALAASTIDSPAENILKVERSILMTLKEQPSFFIEKLSDFFYDMPTGYWPEAPHEGYAISLRSNFDTTSGVLICALSPRRKFDTEYKSFIETIGSAISTVLNNKAKENKVIEAERKYRQLSISLEEKVKLRTEELTEKNDQLNEAQQIAQIGNWEWDLDKNEVIWSDEMFRIYGYGEHRFRVTLEKATERMLPADAEKTKERTRMQVAEALLSFKETGRTIHNNPPVEYPIFFPNGENKILRGIGKIVISPQGTVARIIGTVQDITEQKRAEQKIIAINKQLNEAQQIAQIGNWEWEFETEKLTWSNNLYNIYGIDPSAPISFEQFKSLLYPDDRLITVERIEAALQTKKFNEFFYRIVAPSGEMKTLHARGEVIVDETGKIVKMIGTAQDVTRQKQTEQQLIDANKNLEERNQFVEKLINSSLDLIMVIDKEFRLITVNRQAESNLKSHWEESLLGKKIEEIDPSLQNTEAYQDLLRALRGEVVIRDKQKSQISDKYYEHNYIPLHDAAGTVYAVMVISHDITENIRQMEELKRLSESDQLKSDFIKMASHELKTPVTSIKGYVQLLLSALKSEQEEKDIPPLLLKSSLVSIDKQVARLTRLMSELLDLSKIETGKLELYLEKFNLNELVIDIVQDVLYTNSKHSVNVFHDFESHVYADKDRVGQVLINLLTNAIKYSPDAGKVDVWVRRGEKNSVSVSVKDYGIGIDKKYHERVFERFYRVEGKEEQTYPGFGIGLFIAREIIQRHGGIISVASEKTKGSVFTFTLPAIQ